MTDEEMLESKMEICDQLDDCLGCPFLSCCDGSVEHANSLNTFDVEYFETKE